MTACILEASGRRYRRIQGVCVWGGSQGVVHVGRGSQVGCTWAPAADQFLGAASWSVWQIIGTSSA